MAAAGRLGGFVRLKLSSRKSDLARLQAYQVGEKLAQEISGLKIEYRFRESLGDQNQEDPLWKMPSKGVFTEDFKADLLSGETDMVVHSWKDLPTDLGGQTEIIATLPRADAQDLLLFKKKSIGNKSVKIFSSSPRRSWNLSKLLPELFPIGTGVEVVFENVRGNIQTRVKKLLQNENIDGLILAKAAMDRLLTAEAAEFQHTREFLKEALLDLNWMVLPISENPTAAAQGAIAVEVRSDRHDLKKLISVINCESTFLSATFERNLLKAFGGGCHLALGMSHQNFTDFEVVTVKGKTPEGVETFKRELNLKKEKSRIMLANDLCWSSSQLQKIRTELNVSLPKNFGYVISRSESWNQKASDYEYLWAAGIETWKKLALKGFWVQGCFDSLGEGYQPPVASLAPGLQWMTLTHQDHPHFDQNRHIATYKLDCKMGDLTKFRYFFWKSSSDFLKALLDNPQLIDFYHACGPGSTYQTIKSKIPMDQIRIFFNETEWRKSL